MSLNGIGNVSRLVARLCDCGYTNTDLAILLRDMDIDGSIANDIAQLMTTYDSTTFLSTVHNTGATQAITICDELCTPTTIDKLLALSIILPTLSDNQIINHNTHTHLKILQAYGQGYRIIPGNNIDNKSYYTDNYAFTMHNAMNNGLHLSYIKIDSDVTTCNETKQPENLREIRTLYLSQINDGTLHTLSECNNVEELWIVSKNNTDDLSIALESCKCIRNLKKICAIGPIDKYLKYFPCLEEFNARNCSKITTLDPFAKHLKILYASFTDNVNDDCIKLCTNLRELRANYNAIITTCEPFAKTLKILWADGVCGISDNGLRHCAYIKRLHADNNEKITTCAPFAKCLKLLYACGPSGITDDGLSLCARIVELHADDNEKITTCEPFANHLKVLRACNICGISNNGLKSCTGITQLHADDNKKITTCEPFAHTLKILYAEKACGISDIGLKLCTHITELRVSHNTKITTCDPFAKTLKILYATGARYGEDYTRITGYLDGQRFGCKESIHQCGITDDGLKLCTMIEEIYIDDNNNVTSCAPFATRLRILYADKACGISDDGLKLCTNIQKLNVGKNARITTCAPFLRALTSVFVDSSNSTLINELKLHTHVCVNHLK